MDNGILVISTTEHREPDLQTKIAIYLGLPTRLREQGYILTQDIWKRGSWTSKIWSGYTHGYRSCNDIHSQKRLLDKGSNHTLLIGELIITKCSGV